MCTLGRWRCVPTQNNEHHTHEIEITETDIASITGRARATICELRVEATELRAWVAQQEAIHHG